ncbi:ApaG domain [Methylacidimicrobium sp. B4]|uniref:ApaG domain-containing protein n=1 Tax=Methylacidimicrobium sp. B4 TaxID=2796139 RepID=UPI001A8F2311|nr:ApaG domain [Methylacidimicrobium sp. B4]QSR85246.1 ApaG domain [Methylacidimicrobium sp. B4]
MKHAFSPQAVPGLEVKIERLRFRASSEGESERPLVCQYYLSIRNGSDRTVRLQGRKWVLTDEETGERVVIEGEGIVGSFPELRPGGKFCYSSYHLYRQATLAEGAYFGQDDGGRAIVVGVPPFRMAAAPEGEADRALP